jgi:hypothetical protein
MHIRIIDSMVGGAVMNKSRTCTAKTKAGKIRCTLRRNGQLRWSLNGAPLLITQLKDHLRVVGAAEGYPGRP